MAIENVIYQPQFDSHINDDRVIITLVNGAVPGFGSEHVRAIKFKRNTKLGNHWREYPEIYGIIGKAVFTLEDIETKEQIKYNLVTGDRLLIPPCVALKVEASAGTIVLTCSQQSDRYQKTHKYDVL